MTLIPLDVPKHAQEDFIKNYQAITKGTNRLMLFAADQKMEHLNNDFYGPLIHPEANNPEHIFKIASNGRIGALATHLGLIARYGQNYKDINYIVKLNSKTNSITEDQKEPNSKMLWTVDDVINFKNNSNLKICGVGYTIYIGSEFENEMLSQASQIVYKAHQHGLIATLWIYARGKNLKYKKEIELMPGLTGIANCLGADFVKIKPPENKDNIAAYDILKVAIQAAGNTKIICSGGIAKQTEIFLKELYEQINSGSSGNATGRNIFQRSLQDAVAFTNAISAIVYDNKNNEEAFNIYKSMNKN